MIITIDMYHEPIHNGPNLNQRCNIYKGIQNCPTEIQCTPYIGDNFNSVPFLYIEENNVYSLHFYGQVCTSDKAIYIQSYKNNFHYF